MDWRSMEAKWQKRWADAKIFEADPNQNAKFFATFPYPYVNGPAHLGHAFTFAKVDAHARFKRMQGFNVLFPQGFHATGEPIAGVAERIKKGDQQQIDMVLSSGISKEMLEKFTDPKFIATYWTDRFVEDFTMYGASVDWRRKFITTTITPQYSRFIEWQYNTLKKMGYVVQGTHPVVWCPNCGSPTGAHDRLTGGEASILEFIILKFELEKGVFLTPATLRPETIFGVVNMWVKPDGDYVIADVGKEKWILSEDASKRLGLQKNIKIVKRLKGKELVNKKCKNPVTGETVPIYPADFVDTKIATGVVMSVPSHAPYDWMGVYELKAKGIDIKPIALIETPGLGEHPGVDICKEMGIKSQTDPKLEEATNSIYKKEFHNGVLNKRCGKYAGMKVAQAKDIITKDFNEKGIADILYECSEKVVCRCNTECVVKILENQWFLKFSDEAWKDKTRKALSMMRIYPEQVRFEFEHTISWLKEKACTRRGGLGTPLPWDKSWIVETLSDSTIYMAYYTISNYINQLKIPAEKLTDEVFDYVFLGKGNPEEISKKSGLGPLIIKKMHDEFEYWYPVDLRCSAYELVPNHLTFYLFHHTAIWPEKKWPKAIATNGMVMVEGQKMSKSLGNWITLKDGINKYGADPLRLTLLYAAEGNNNPDWREKQAFSNSSKLEEIIKLSKQLGKLKKVPETRVDKWITSRIQTHTGLATVSYEEARTRAAIQSSFYDMYNDMKWYLNRGGANLETVKYFLKNIALLIAPVCPHTAEEIWGELGNEGLISIATWPAKNEKLVDKKVELAESLVKQTVEDMVEIKKLLKSTPRKIYLYVAPNWKQKLVGIIAENPERSKDKIIRLALGEPDIKEYGNEVIKLVTKLLEDPSKIPEIILGTDEEAEVLRSAAELFKAELGAESVEVAEAEHAMYDPKSKCKFAMPFKPAIYME